LEVGLAEFYADAAALGKLDPNEREERLGVWDARARAGSATSAVR
jgi:hypothetical protein